MSLPTGSHPLQLSPLGLPPHTQPKADPAGLPGSEAGAAVLGLLPFLSPSLPVQEHHCLEASLPASGCSPTTLSVVGLRSIVEATPALGTQLLLWSLRRACGVCSAAQSGPYLHRVCGLW